MALTVTQRILLGKQAQTFASRMLAAQFVRAANTVMAAEPDSASPGTTKRKDASDTEQTFFKDATKFVKHNDAAGLINDLEDGRKNLQHNFDWMASYFKQLRPIIEKFTKRMIKVDPSGFSRSQLQQLAGIVGAVLRLAEVLDSAGAVAEDIIQFTGDLEAQLKNAAPSTDRKKSGLRNLFGR
jgi:hypothetical protein